MSILTDFQFLAKPAIQSILAANIMLLEKHPYSFTTTLSEYVIHKMNNMDAFICRFFLEQGLLLSHLKNKHNFKDFIFKLYALEKLEFEDIVQSDDGLFFKLVKTSQDDENFPIFVPFDPLWHQVAKLKLESEIKHAHIILWLIYRSLLMGTSNTHKHVPDTYHIAMRYLERIIPDDRAIYALEMFTTRMNSYGYEIDVAGLTIPIYQRFLVPEIEDVKDNKYSDLDAVRVLLINPPFTEPMFQKVTEDLTSLDYDYDYAVLIVPEWNDLKAKVMALFNVIKVFNTDNKLIPHKEHVLKCTIYIIQK